MSSPTGGARFDRDSGRGWERQHKREHRDLDARVRRLERAVWSMTAVLSTTTVIGLVNLARSLAGVDQ